MLEQLIESTNHKNENRRRGGFLLTTFTAVFSAVILAGIYSLFSYNLVMASEGLNLSTLVSPVAIAETAPEPPPATSEPKISAAAKTLNKLPTRTENILDINESPNKPPEGISSEKSTKVSRPQSGFVLGDRNTAGSVSSGNSSDRGNRSDYNSTGINVADDNSKEVETTPPPVIKKPMIKADPPKTIIKTGGVVNGKAINLITPIYPATAKAIHAGGTVNVQVMIDEEGNVQSASAVSGHPLLRQAAEKAAKATKFSPTFLSSQKVKVSGVIVYNFIAQ
jgi:TonB family protein